MLFGWGLHRVEAGLLIIIFYVLFIYLFLCFIYLFIFMFYLFIYLFIYFLASTRSEFPLRGVSIYVLVFVNLFIYLLIYLGAPWRVHFWYSCMLMACNFINNEILQAFTGLLSVGECIPSKNNGSRLFLLEMNFTMDIKYISSSFHHAFMLQ